MLYLFIFLERDKRIDDQINDIDTPLRHTPKGWIGVDNYIDAIEYINKNLVTHISFDHDLGNEFTGYDIACKIEELAFEGKIQPIIWDIHSANPIGRKRIEITMKNADKYWNNYNK